jgi:hypothetical protein
VYAGGVLSSLPRSVSLQKFFIAACVRTNQVATTMGDYRFWRQSWFWYMVTRAWGCSSCSKVSSCCFVLVKQHSRSGSAVEMIIAQGIDLAKVVASTELAVSGTVVSSNLTYLAPTVEVHLPPATLKTELMKVGDSHRLKVSSPVLARSLHQFRRGRCGSFRQLFRSAAGTIRRNYDQDKSERRKPCVKG